jgi:hypothetical protein
LHEALRRNRQRSASNFLPIYKFPDGKTDLRILPASKKDNKDDWFIPVGQHFNLEDKFGVFCPYETFWANETCPVCEMVSALRRDGLNDEANRLSVRRSYYIRAIIRGEEDKGAQVVRLPATLFTQIGEIVSQEDVFGDVLHPGKGRDIRVTKSGQKLNTSYSAMALPKTRMILDTVDETKALIAGLDSIASLVEVPSAEHLTKLLESKVGFSLKPSTPSLGDTFSDEDMFSTEPEEDSPSGDDFSFGSDDEEDDDVPFAAEEEDTEDGGGDDDSFTVSSDDLNSDDGDSWLDDDEEEKEKEGDEIMDISSVISSRRQQKGGAELTDDLAGHLEADKPKRANKKQKA